MAVDRPTLTQQLLQVLFPSRCVACDRRGDWICPVCVAQIRFYRPPWPVMLQEYGPLRGVRAAAQFVGPLQKAVHRFKYNGLRALAPMLGQMLFECWQQDPLPVEVIVPVPLHTARLRQRGYNQSALLARELAQRTGLPVSEGHLVRRIPTPPQVGLTASERAANVCGAFSWRAGSLTGQGVVLVDDVLTTGATLRACGEELLRANAREVWGLTLARD